MGACAEVTMAWDLEAFVSKVGIARAMKIATFNVNNINKRLTNLAGYSAS